MIWYMIWYDMIWYDMIWYDIWYDMIWYERGIVEIISKALPVVNIKVSSLYHP